MMQLKRYMGGLGIQGAIVLSLVLLFAFTASAQLPTGTILGTVKDSTGGTVAGAAVTATNADTGATRTGTTGEDGTYRFSALPVGNWTVRVAKEGFQTAERKGFTLEVAQEAAIDLTLQVGSTGQTVVVTEEAPIVNTTSSAVGGLVSEDKITDLPLNGRNYTDLTLLQTGINAVKSVGTSAGMQGTWFSSNGAPPRSNSILLDGASLVNMFGGTASSVAGSSLGLDGIREYKVVTNTFSAEYGMTMGSQVTLVSRSGTNLFHGTAFEYLRNSVLDARNTFDQTDVSNVNGMGTDKLVAYPGKRIPPFKRNNFGASFGGPLEKDKTFFFLTYEQLIERKGISVVDNALPSICHNNLGTTAAPAVDSSCFTALSTVNGANIPAATGTAVLVNPTTFGLLALFPLPTFPNKVYGGHLLYVPPYVQPTGDRFGQVRVDHNFSNADDIFLRYTLDDSNENQAIGTAFFPSEVYNALVSRNQFITLSETHVFNPAVLNTARVSVSRTRLFADTPTTIPSSIPNVLQTGWSMGPVTISGFTGFSPDSCNPTHFTQNQITYSDDLFVTHGNHALKFGGLVNHFMSIANYNCFVKGSLSATNLANFLGSGTFLVGGVPQPNFQTAQNEQPGTIEYRNMRYTTWGFYAQDDYRLNRRLTLNAGLRYEFNTTPTEVNGYGSALQRLSDTAGTLGPIQRNRSHLNFSPRIGFAWDIFGDGKTSLRGGGGVFFDVGNIGSLIGQESIGTPPFSARTTVNAASVGFNTAAEPAFVLPLNQWFPQFGTGGNTAAPIGIGKFLQIISYDGGNPHLWVGNLSVERQLPFNSVLTVTYAMSRGDQIYRIIEGNPMVPCTYGGQSGFEGDKLPVYTATVGGVPDSPCPGGLARTNTFWNSIRYTPPMAYTWYDALQVGYTKRISHGLQWQVSYTYSKLLDTTQGVLPNDGTGGSGSLGANPYNQFYDKGPAVFNIPQNLRINGSYRLPEFVKSNGFASKAANGWWVSTITTWQSGYPFSVVLNGSRTLQQIDGGAAGVDRPNWAPGFNPSNAIVGNTTTWYNPNAFAIQALGHLGNVARDSLTGPNLHEIDVSFNKDTKARFLGESGMIQFRLDVFNILNRANYALPSASVVTPPITGTAACPLSGCPVGVTGGVGVAPLATAGNITSTIASSRQLQVALRVIF